MKLSVEMDSSRDSKVMEQIKKAFMAGDKVFLKIYDYEVALTILPELVQNSEFGGTIKMKCDLST